MQAMSRSVVSSQTAVHDDLLRRVERARENAWQRPPAAHTKEAFTRAEQWLIESERPLILDSGCGVGLSTRTLARRHPEYDVLGIDRSADRLGRDHGPLPDNALLIRADLIDFWRLARAAGWRPAHHYLLYPNPYPKSAQLKKRWHAHPVFPTLIALGGTLELRTNWDIYAHEFALAVKTLSARESPVERFTPDDAFLTPFERKYAESGQSLWRYRVTLDAHTRQMS